MGTLRKMKRGRVNSSPMDPKLTEAWNKGYDTGFKQGASEQREKDIQSTVTLLEGLEGIYGIGEKIAWKIREHILKQFGK